MTGLEKIIKHIGDNADTSANELIKQAKSKAAQIIADVKAEGDKKCSEIRRQSELAVSASLSRAESAARLKEKRLILEAKQKMIDEIIVKARNHIAELPDKEYFDLVLKMVSKYALCKSGLILFSPYDLGRMPGQFDSAIRTALMDKKGAELVISTETRDIDGGFVLLYGEIEENCSFDALFLASRESLQDKVSSLLFG